jgi:hypothetical protein
MATLRWPVAAIFVPLSAAEAAMPLSDLTWLTFAGSRWLRGFDLLFRGFWVQNVRTNEDGGRVSC